MMLRDHRWPSRTFFLFAFCTLLAFALIAALHGCGSSSSNNRVAFVRFLLATSEFGEVDLLVNDLIELSGVSSGEASEFLEVNDDRVDLRVLSRADGRELTTFSAGLDADHRYTYVVTSADGAALPIFLEDERIPPPTGEFTLRILNASSSLASLDAYLDRGNPPLNETTPFAEEVPFLDASSYKEDRADDYRIRITENSSSKIVADTGLLFFQAGEVVTAAVIETEEGSNQFRIVVMRDDPPLPLR